MEKIPNKKRPEIKKALTNYMEYHFPGEQKIYTYIYLINEIRILIYKKNLTWTTVNTVGTPWDLIVNIISSPNLSTSSSADTKNKT